MSSRLAPFLPLLVAVAAGCGGASSADKGAVEDRRGTPFRLTREQVEAAGLVASLGDTDRALPGDDQGLRIGAAAPVKPSVAAGLDDYRSVPFEDLGGFECSDYAAEGTQSVVPESIQALSGKRIAVDGYMWPLVYDNGARKFLLFRTQFGCCAAVTPKINEWIEVTMEGDKVADYIPHALVTVYGTLTVKEETRGTAAVGLYKMQAARTEFTEAK
jgi:hypothetical protein